MENFEGFEWIHSWCDETEKDDLPRVLLIGDSICNGYQFKVRELLRGVCYVDYVATSYAINLGVYKNLILSMARGLNYDIIHFNNGLHGESLNLRTYKAKMEYFTKEFMKTSKVILVTSTLALEQNSKKYHHSWYKKILSRNEVVEEVAKEHGLSIDRLYEVSKEMKMEDRNPDGFHYTEKGFEILANKVVSSIKEELNK